jgi:hypothetical protein
MAQKPNEDGKLSLHLSLNPTEYRLLAAMAGEEDRSLSAQVRHLIRKEWAQRQQQHADVDHVAPVVPNAL